VITAAHTTILNDFISTFFLMMTNPMTIFGFIVLFASFGLSKIEENFWNASVLVLGIGVGSVIGWALICEIVALFRDKMTSQVMRWVNRIAGVLILAFGFAAWGTLIF
jgi:threonine/homoserine/homoserine lactone efflux protein